jgi:hypothetical protein
MSHINKVVSDNIDDRESGVNAKQEAILVEASPCPVIV